MAIRAQEEKDRELEERKVIGHGGDGAGNVGDGAGHGGGGAGHGGDGGPGDHAPPGAGQGAQAAEEGAPLHAPR